MPYIGKSPVGGGFHKLDNLTASATATYALTLGGAAYYPETANQLLVSLNGVIQAPQDSFTVSGSNLVFDSALTASDSIDFVVALGDVLGVGSVTDGAITTAKIANNAVTMDKLATSGTLPALDGSNLTNVSAGKVLQVKSFELTDQFSFTTNQTWTDITGLDNCSITKSDAANHVLIQISIGAWDNSSTNARRGIRLRRNGSALADGTNVGNRQAGIMTIIDHQYNRPKPVAFNYLDKTGTDITVTYGIQARHEAGNTFINSSSTDDNISSYYPASSNIILTEIQA